MRFSGYPPNSGRCVTNAIILQCLGTGAIRNSIAEPCPNHPYGLLFSIIKPRETVVGRKRGEKGYFCLNIAGLERTKSCAESSLKH